MEGKNFSIDFLIRRFYENGYSKEDIIELLREGHNIDITERELNHFWKIFEKDEELSAKRFFSQQSDLNYGINPEVKKAGYLYRVTNDERYKNQILEFDETYF